MMRLTLLSLSVSLVMLAPEVASAQGKAALARETAEYVMSKFGKEAAETGVETLSAKIESLALRHGDEAIQAVRKVGPQAIRVADEAGPHQAQAIALMARRGDDAMWVVSRRRRLAMAAQHGDAAADAMIRHGEIAEPLLAASGKPAAAALNAVSPRNARRLAMLADDGQLTDMGRTPELLAVVARYGDRAMAFIWNNKGALTVSAALAAFLADPQPFLDGTVQLAEIGADAAVKPLTSVPGQVASAAAERVNWTAVVLGALALAVAFAGWKSWLKHRANRRAG